MGGTTYGKGTVQQVFDLDNAVTPAANALKPLGSLKLTIQKFYRVSGGSTQFKGVVLQKTTRAAGFFLAPTGGPTQESGAVTITAQP